LTLAAMQEVYRVNCVLPLLWLSVLAPGLRKNPDCRIAVLSARVGSIGDNGLGGWYSYRSAKAALNMGLKSASIEFARRAKGVKLIAFHPGTVATELSAPFQRGVPEGKLFAPDFVAQRLDTLLNAHPADGQVSYLDWAGEPIPW
ncbi:MAG: SDR family NAD(P)-dependent oxidoreductase, partial [Congregibacter sp.]|nr:SDR family NAD(P)-dependent oxidoreductase [Congregibacter sp.]